MLVFLIGFMGCGKTTAGQALADKLACEYIDMDTLIEQNTQKTITQIFAEQGEDAFRLLEKQTIQGLSQKENAVIATGGGAPCFFDNMDVMNQAGQTIYLKLTPKGLAERLRNNQEERPLVKGKNDEELLEFIIMKLNEREGFYSKAKHVVLNDGITVDLLLEQLGFLFS